MRKFILLALWALIELAILVYLLVDNKFSTYILPFLYLSGIGVALSIQVDDTKLSTSKLSWTIVILTIPVLGIILYMIFGHGYMSNYQKKLLSGSRFNYPSVSKYRLTDIKLSDQQHNIVNYLDLMPFSTSYLHNGGDIKYFNYGTDKFKMMFDDIANARYYIHIEYFIIKPGKLYNKLEKLLIKKAQEGVEIRILCDYVGGREITKTMIDTLSQHNIKFAFFNKLVISMLSKVSNFRDHRKIVVIDGNIVYTGGFNIADEYIDLDNYYKHWEDFHLRIANSSVVLEYETFFGQTWYFATNESLFKQKYYINYDVDKENNDSYLYPFIDGPDTIETFVRDVFFKCIMSATKSIYITTPYLIPDMVLIEALVIQANSGIDITIITPGLPDKKYVKLATESYYYELLKVGVKIYEYKGFIHAKKMLIDETHAIVGTANFDMRSFRLSFEVCCLIIGGQAISDIKSSIDDNIANAKQVTNEKMKEHGVFKRILYTLIRVFSPLF
ncbi:MAG: cardiolipin synthase [Bacilli bacterium]|jgi:cardiolipin synthase|nr:cardiolipin synthase [Bacilli bacterium]